MKVYKIDLRPYVIDSREKNPAAKEGEKDYIVKSKSVDVKYYLPHHLCNNEYGGKAEVFPNGSARILPDPGYDLMALGPVCNRIQTCQDDFLIVSEAELEVLKKRAQVVSKYFGLDAFEMFNRITTAELAEAELKK